MIKCSACILTYNNEKTIGKCLESVRDFSDIVILDGGSTDGTMDIAKKYGARIFFQHDGGQSAKIMDFTGVREKLYSLARENWRFWLDSDEWLSKEAAEETKNITDGNLENKLYSFQRKAIVEKRIVEYMYCYPEYCNRLFNKNSNIFLKKGKKVHEDMIAGEGAAVQKSNAVIYHFWDESYTQLKQKDNYYIELAVKGKDNFCLNNKLRIAYINLLKGAKVFVISLLIYLRHGFKKTLPISHSWRFVRYHLVYAQKILTLRPHNADKAT